MRTDIQAADMSTLVTWINGWATQLQLVGIALIVVMLVVVGIKIAGSAASSQGSGGLRNSLGSLFTLVLAGILIGSALIIGPILTAAQS